MTRSIDVPDIMRQRLEETIDLVRWLPEFEDSPDSGATPEARYPVPPSISLNRQSDCAVSDDLTLVPSLNSTPSPPEIAMS
ncbi:MAG: hypothetical protein QOH27_5011 [Mycobacterium sp.]|nr:hypothetical protein [Mycobacterium sp.]